MRVCIALIILSSFVQLGLLQQCRQVCEYDVTVGGGAQKGDVGAPGKAGPQGVKGQKGETGIGERGIKGESFSLGSFENELREMVSDILSFLFTSCKDLLDAGFTRSGVYTISPFGNNAERLRVYCDQTTDGGGWMIIQRRTDGSVDFYRNWTTYQTFFGDVHGEYWLGLDDIHRITTSANYELRFDLEDYANETTHATYSSFNVGNAASNYLLTVSGYSGSAGNSFTRGNGNGFSTFDQDHDTNRFNCAELYHGAWWYESCHYSNLNGLYGSTAYGEGLTWFHWHGYEYSIKSTEMKIRIL